MSHGLDGMGLAQDFMVVAGFQILDDGGSSALVSLKDGKKEDRRAVRINVCVCACVCGEVMLLAW